MTRHLALISPHRDDAALSIGATIATLTAAGVRITLVSCFTRSNWAPCLPAGSDECAVTRVRADEDMSYVEALGSGAKLISLDMLDGPLRADWRPYETWPEVDAHPLSAECMATLQEQLFALRDTTGGWALPLALEHRDHAIARAAGVAAAGRSPLLFYEDIPYAFWFTETELRHRIGCLQDLIGESLQPHVLHDAAHLCSWYRAARHYQSQFPGPAIDSFGRLLQMRGGERIWVTREFEMWCGLT